MAFHDDVNVCFFMLVSVRDLYADRGDDSDLSLYTSGEQPPRTDAIKNGIRYSCRNAIIFSLCEMRSSGSLVKDHHHEKNSNK